jgi:hypothetical protein
MIVLWYFAKQKDVYLVQKNGFAFLHAALAFAHADIDLAFSWPLGTSLCRVIYALCKIFEVLDIVCT